MSNSELIELAKSIHKDIITLDAHIDIEVTFLTPEKEGKAGFEKLASLKKMDEGSLDGAFFAAYVAQGPLTEKGFKEAYNTVANKIEQIHLTHKKMLDKVGIAYHPKEILPIIKSGKKFVIIAIENGYAIGEDITNIKKFYELGARYITLSHIGHSQICDSNLNPQGNETLHNGLSSFGREVVPEMNRLGMIIDVAHISKKSVLDIIELTKAPVMCSHSGIKSISGNQTLWDDEQLDALKKNGGVIHIVGLNRAIKSDPEEKIVEINNLRKELGFPTEFWAFFKAFDTLFEDSDATPKDNRSQYSQRLNEIEKKYPSANVSDYVDHIDYVVSRIGIDHVGISSDFYENSYCLEGWRDVSENYNVTLELVKRGYSKKDIEKIWSGNILQLWDNVEKAVENMNKDLKSIIFACIGNSCRSQMAEGIANHLSEGKVSVQSAGTKPEKKVTPFAIQVMKEIGIDISHQEPKLITVDMLNASTHFVSMGCGVQEACPVPIGVPNIEDWDIEDPWGKDIQFFRKTRDIVKEKVENLLKKLSNLRLEN